MSWRSPRTGRYVPRIASCTHSSPCGHRPAPRAYGRCEWRTSANASFDAFDGGMRRLSAVRCHTRPVNVGPRRYVELFARYVGAEWRRAVLLAALLLATIGLQIANPQLLRRFID